MARLRARPLNDDGAIEFELAVPDSARIRKDAVAVLRDHGMSEEQVVALIGVCPRCLSEVDNPHTCPEVA